MVSSDNSLDEKAASELAASKLLHTSNQGTEKGQQKR